MHRTVSCVALLIAVGSLGCANRSAASIFEGCIHAALMGSESNDTAKTERVVPDGAELLGLPGRALTTAELERLGLEAGVVEFLASSDSRANRWCNVRAHTEKPSETDGRVPIASSECVETSIAVERPMRLPVGGLVAVELSRSAEGQFVLTKAELK